MKQFVLFLSLLILSPVFAHAKAMTVDADKFELYEKEQRAEFYGNVIVHRDAMILKAEHITIWYEEAQRKKTLKSVVAVGKVLIHTPQHKGSAKKASFSTASDLLILTGDARMESERGVVKGDQIEYNTVTENTQVISKEKDTQVHFTFEEKPNE